MGLKKYKPVTPGRRFSSMSVSGEDRKASPEKKLVRRKQKKAGRSGGRISMRHRGGGSRYMYRLVDFKRDKPGVPARVARIEYDPGRSANIALLHYADGEKRYILAPEGIAAGAALFSGPEAEPSVGNALPLSNIPLGVSIHNVELIPGRGAQMARSAGVGAVLMSREGKYAHVRLPSGEVRMVDVRCMATLGRVGNSDHENEVLGKAGRARLKGRRPRVRGVAMNPVDHPMGGGEGRASGGHPRSPWGQYAKGMKTRSKHKSDRFIVSRRKRGK